MKYVKHFYVDPITGVAFTDPNVQNGPNGKTHPAIPGLHVEFNFVDENGVDFCLSTVDDGVTITGDGVSELTEEEFFDIIETHFDKVRDGTVLALYQYVKNIKSQVIDVWWHHSETSVAVAQKIAEARLAIDAADEAEAATLAPLVALEAQVREMSIIELATRIIANHDTLIQAEAVVSGIRGKHADNLAAIPFARTSIDDARASIGAVSVKTNPDGQGYDITDGFAAVLEGVNI